MCGNAYYLSFLFSSGNPRLSSSLWRSAKRKYSSDCCWHCFFKVSKSTSLRSISFFNLRSSSLWVSTISVIRLSCSVTVLLFCHKSVNPIVFWFDLVITSNLHESLTARSLPSVGLFRVPIWRFAPKFWYDKFLIRFSVWWDQSWVYILTKIKIKWIQSDT